MLKLAQQSGLEEQVAALRHATTAPGAGVTLSLRQNLAIASVMARKGAHDALAGRVQETYGLPLPGQLARSAAGPMSFVWTAPAQWLAISEAVEPVSFETSLRTALSPLVSIVNQSDGRVVIRVGGPKVRDMLAKGVSLDLHPTAFKPDTAASTMVGHIGVTFWQLDELPTYEFAVFRSFAGALWEHLVESAAEFGVSLEL